MRLGLSAFALAASLVIASMVSLCASAQATVTDGSGGTVTVKGRLMPDGTIAGAEIVMSEPAGKFDDVALRTLKSWKFAPSPADNRVRGVEVYETLNFLNDAVLKDGVLPERGPATAAGGIEAATTAGPEGQPRVNRSQGPRWPRAAMSPFTGGWLKVEGEVNAAGEVLALRVVESHPPGMFDRVALEAMRRWTYEPRSAGGADTARPITQILKFNVGLFTLGAMQSTYLTESRDDAKRLLLDLAALCPDRYRRADDALNRALAGAPRKRPLPVVSSTELSASTPEAIEQLLSNGECLFTSWEQVRDQAAYHAATRFAAFEQSLDWRSAAALCEKAIGLGPDKKLCTPFMTPSDSDRLHARRWVASQFAEGYQALIVQDPRATATALQDSTRQTLTAAKQARLNGEVSKPVTMLVRAIKQAKQPEDVAILRLGLARVYLDINSRGEAYEELLKLLGSRDTPWYAQQMARVMFLVTYEGWHDEGGDEFERTAAALNRELGVTDRLGY